MSRGHAAAMEQDSTAVRFRPGELCASGGSVLDLLDRGGSSAWRAGLVGCRHAVGIWKRIDDAT